MKAHSVGLLVAVKLAISVKQGTYHEKEKDSEIEERKNDK
jgi:hypothetical protein